VSVPHVVLEGSVDLRRYAEEFQPILIRRSGDILMTHPERSGGVQDLVAHVGADLLARSPGARVKVTNLVLPSVSAGIRASRSRDEEERE
jgi:hypothetical protein